MWLWLYSTWLGNAVDLVRTVLDANFRLDVRYRYWGSSWLYPGTFQDTTSIKGTALPSKSFPVHCSPPSWSSVRHSDVTWCAGGEVNRTASSAGCASVWSHVHTRTSEHISSLIGSL
jgi:hypothetical protein